MSCIFWRGANKPSHRCLVSPRHANTGLRTRCKWKETAARFVFSQEKNNQNQPWMKSPTVNNMAFCIPAGSCEARKTRCSLEWTTESCRRQAAEELLGPTFPWISPPCSVLPLLGLLLALHFFPSLLPRTLHAVRLLPGNKGGAV